MVLHRPANDAYPAVRHQQVMVRHRDVHAPPDQRFAVLGIARGQRPGAAEDARQERMLGERHMEHHEHGRGKIAGQPGDGLFQSRDAAGRGAHDHCALRNHSRSRQVLPTRHHASASPARVGTRARSARVLQ
jgi:hypothetical protein